MSSERGASDTSKDRTAIRSVLHHFEQDDWPVAFWNSPRPQSRQAEKLEAEANLPTGHLVLCKKNRSRAEHEKAVTERAVKQGDELDSMLTTRSAQAG